MSEPRFTLQCAHCHLEFASEEALQIHLKTHMASIPGSDMDFIPEVEIDENTGQPKKPAFRQEPYTPLTDYGG